MVGFPAFLSQHVGGVDLSTGVFPGDCFMRLLAVLHVLECPITPQLLDGPFCLLLWKLLQIRVPHHDFAGAVVSAMYAPHLHVKLVPEGCHHRKFVDLSVYVPLP